VGIERRGDVLHGLPRLGLDSTGYQLHCSGPNADHPGKEDDFTHSDRVGKR
jgi:hypothetical protein